MTRELQLPGAWPTLVDEVVQAARGRRLVVLLDGGSGAGKTTLARRLHRDLEARLGTTQLVSLDDVYPGWHGLAAASELVRDTLLGSRAEARGWLQPAHVERLLREHDAGSWDWSGEIWRLLMLELWMERYLDR